MLLARLVDDDVGLRRLPVDAPKAREGVDRGAEDLVSGESEIQFTNRSHHTQGAFIVSYDHTVAILAIHGIVFDDSSCIQF